MLRLDRNVSTNWRADVNYRFGSIRELGAAQADISGLLPGNVKGQPVALEDLPREPRFLAGGLTGQLSPHFLNETRVSYVRGYLAFTRVDPFPQVPGINVAMDVGVVDEPIGVSIGGARSQVANQHTYQVINNSTWNRDKHTILFGGTWRREYWYFNRTDQLSGSLTTPVATVNSGTNLSIPGSALPPTCSATLTTNCLLAADVGRFTQPVRIVAGDGRQRRRAGDARHQPAAAAARHAAGSRDRQRRVRALCERLVAARVIADP